MVSPGAPGAAGPTTRHRPSSAVQGLRPGGSPRAPCAQKCLRYLGSSTKKPAKLPIKLSLRCQATPFGTLKFGEGVEGAPSQGASVSAAAAKPPAAVPREEDGSERTDQGSVPGKVSSCMTRSSDHNAPPTAHSSPLRGSAPSDLPAEGVCRPSECSTAIPLQPAAPPASAMLSFKRDSLNPLAMWG